LNEYFCEVASHNLTSRKRERMSSQDKLVDEFEELFVLEDLENDEILNQNDLESDEDLNDELRDMVREIPNEEDVENDDDLDSDEDVANELRDMFRAACAIGTPPQRTLLFQVLTDSIIETPEGFSTILSPPSSTKPQATVFDTPQSANSKGESKNESIVDPTCTKKNSDTFPKMAIPSVSSNGSLNKENQELVDNTIIEDESKKSLKKTSSSTPNDYWYTGPRTRSRAKAEDRVFVATTSQH